MTSVFGYSLISAETFIFLLANLFCGNGLSFQGDIISSLRNRLDIISDEADDKADLTSNYGGELTGDVSAEKAVHLLNLRELR